MERARCDLDNVKLSLKDSDLDKSDAIELRGVTPEQEIRSRIWPRSRSKSVYCCKPMRLRHDIKSDIAFSRFCISIIHVYIKNTKPNNIRRHRT